MPKQLSDDEKELLDSLRSGWADNEMPFKKRQKYRGTAIAALLSQGAHVMKGDPLNVQPIPRMLQDFAKSNPIAGAERRTMLLHGNEEFRPETLGITERITDRWGGDRLAQTLGEFQDRINEGLSELRSDDGRAPIISFMVLDRDMFKYVRDRYRPPEDPASGLFFHTDGQNLLNPKSYGLDKLIGVVIIPMEKSSATIFEGKTQTIIPPDGEIVFFHPKEVHSVPPDTTGTFDGVNHGLLQHRRTVVLGLVHGSDKHSEQMSQMAHAISHGFGMGMTTAFLEGTTHVSEIQDDASKGSTIYIIGNNFYTPQVVLLSLVYFALCFLSRRLEDDAVANLQKAKEAVENLDGTQKTIAQQEVERAEEILRRRQRLKNICPRSSTTHE